MLKTQTKKIKNRKVSKIIAGILSLLMFATSNGSFLVWGLSEGQLNFLGEPAVAQAKTAEAKVIETADAITVDEIMQESQPKKYWWEFWKKQNSNDIKSVKSTAGFSDLKTELVAREVLGDKTVDALSDDLKASKKDNDKNLGSNNDDIDKYIEYIDLTKEQPEKKIGFFKKLWVNFVGLFNNDLKTSILEGVDVSNNPEAQNANRQIQHDMFGLSVRSQATVGNNRFGTALFEDDIEGSMRIFAAQRIADGNENFSPAELVIRDGEDIQRIASYPGVFKRTTRGEYPGVQPLQELKQLFLDAYGRDDLSFHPLYVHSDNPVEDRKRKLIDEKVKKALELQKEYNRQRAEDVASAVRSNQIKSFAQVIKEKEKDGVDVSVAKKLLQRVSKNNDLGIDASRMQIRTSNLDVVNNLSNSSQQATKLKSAEAEEKEGWLVGSWKWFMGWFKNNKDKQITEQEAKDYFGTGGDTIAGLGGGDNDLTTKLEESNKQVDDLIKSQEKELEKYGYDSNNSESNESLEAIAKYQMEKTRNNDYDRQLQNGEIVASNDNPHQNIFNQNIFNSIDDSQIGYARPTSPFVTGSTLSSLVQKREKLQQKIQQLQNSGIVVYDNDNERYDSRYELEKAQRQLYYLNQQILSQGRNNPAYRQNAQRLRQQNIETTKKAIDNLEKEIDSLKNMSDTDYFQRVRQNGKVQPSRQEQIKTKEGLLRVMKHNLGTLSVNEEATENQDKLYAETRPYNPKTDGDIVNPITGEKVQTAKKKEGWLAGLIGKVFGPPEGIAGDGDNTKFFVDGNGDVRDKNGLYKGETWEKYSREARQKIKSDLSNSAQQSAKLKAIEEKNGWLASGLEKVKSWFGGNKNRTETTDEDIASFDSGAGDTIAGIKGDKNNSSSYDDLVEKYGKDDMKNGYGDEIAGIKEQIDKNDSFVTDADGNVISLASTNNNSGFWGSLIEDVNVSYKKIKKITEKSPIGKIIVNHVPSIRDVKQVTDGLSAISTVYSQYTVKTKPKLKPTIIIKAKSATEAMKKAFPVDSEITQQGSNVSIVRDSKGNPIGSIRKDVNGYKIVKFGDKNSFSGSVNQGGGKMKILSTGFKTIEDARITLERQHPILKNSTKRVNPDGTTVYYDKNNRAILSIKKDISGNVVIKDFNQGNKNKKGSTNNQNSLLDVLGTLPVVGGTLSTISNLFKIAQKAPETVDRVSKGEVKPKDAETILSLIALSGGGTVTAPVLLGVEAWKVWESYSPEEKKAIATKAKTTVDDLNESISVYADKAGKFVGEVGDDAVAMMPSGEAGEFTYLGDGKYFYSSNLNDKNIYKRTENGQFIPVILPDNQKKKITTKIDIVESAKEDAWGGSGPSQYFVNSSDSKLYTEVYQSEHKKFQNVNDELEKAMSQDSNLFGFNNKWTNPDTEVALNGIKQRQNPQDDQFDTTNNYGNGDVDVSDNGDRGRMNNHRVWYNPLAWFGGKEDFDSQRAQDDRNYGSGDVDVSDNGGRGRVSNSTGNSLSRQNPQNDQFDTTNNYGNGDVDVSDNGDRGINNHKVWYNPLTWFGGKEDFDGQRAQDDKNYGDGDVDIANNNGDRGRDNYTDDELKGHAIFDAHNYGTPDPTLKDNPRYIAFYNQQIGNTANNNKGQDYNSKEGGSVWYRPTTWFRNWGGLFRENNRDNYVENDQTDGGLPKYLLNNGAGNDNNTVDGGSNEYNNGNNSQKTTDDEDVNSEMISSIFPVEPIDSNILKSNPKFDQTINSMLTANDGYSFSDFLENGVYTGVINGSREAQQQLRYSGADAGDVDVLKIIGSNIIESSTQEFARQAFGEDLNGDGKKELNWFENGVANLAGGVLSGVAIGDTDRLAENVTGAVINMGMASMAEHGVISPDTMQALSGSSQYLSAGAQDMINGDFEQGLKTIGGGFVGDYVDSHIASSVGDIIGGDTGSLVGGVAGSTGSSMVRHLINGDLNMRTVGEEATKQVLTVGTRKVLDTIIINSDVGQDFINGSVNNYLNHVKSLPITNGSKLAMAEKNIGSVRSGAENQITSNYGGAYAGAISAVVSIGSQLFGGEGVSGEMVAQDVMVGLTSYYFGPILGKYLGKMFQRQRKKKAEKDARYVQREIKSTYDLNHIQKLGLSVSEIERATNFARNGNNQQVKKVIRQSLRNSPLGKISSLDGFSIFYDAAVGITGSDLWRINQGNVQPGQIESSRDFFLDQNDTGWWDKSGDEGSKLIDQYIHHKNKLIDCYKRKDQKCLVDTMYHINSLSGDIMSWSDRKFNKEIADLNQQIFKLEQELSHLRNKEKEAELRALKNRRADLRRARDQFANTVSRCSDGLVWSGSYKACVTPEKANNAINSSKNLEGEHVCDRLFLYQIKQRHLEKYCPKTVKEWEDINDEGGDGGSD